LLLILVKQARVPGDDPPRNRASTSLVAHHPRSPRGDDGRPRPRTHDRPGDHRFAVALAPHTTDRTGRGCLAARAERCGRPVGLGERAKRVRLAFISHTILGVLQLVPSLASTTKLPSLNRRLGSISGS
jgi:hypothetical protein